MRWQPGPTGQLLITHARDPAAAWDRFVGLVISAIRAVRQPISRCNGLPVPAAHHPEASESFSRPAPRLTYKRRPHELIRSGLSLLFLAPPLHDSSCAAATHNNSLPPVNLITVGCLPLVLGCGGAPTSVVAVRGLCVRNRPPYNRQLLAGAG
jgi:hypothetical protein